MGTAVALPFLDAMMPAFASAQSTKAARPVRMAFVYVPNGIDMRHWNPSYEGELGVLPQTLLPMEPFKKDITLLGNLTPHRPAVWMEPGSRRHAVPISRAFR
jgi:hypothetical protein